MIDEVPTSFLKPLMLDIAVNEDESVAGLFRGFFRQIQNWKYISRSWYV